MASILVEVDAVGANVTVPDDGDAAGAASVITSIQELTNRSRHTINNFELMRGGFTDAQGAPPALTFEETLTEANASTVVKLLVNPAILLAAGDKVHIFGSIFMTSAVGINLLGLRDAGTATNIVGAMWRVDQAVATQQSLTISAIIDVTALGNPTSLDMRIFNHGGSGGADSVDLMRPWNLTAQVLRA